MTTVLLERLENQLEAMALSKIPETIPESLGEKSTSDPITDAGCLGSLLG